MEGKEAGLAPKYTPIWAAETGAPSRPGTLKGPHYAPAGAWWPLGIGCRWQRIRGGVLRFNLRLVSTASSAVSLVIVTFLCLTLVSAVSRVWRFRFTFLALLLVPGLVAVVAHRLFK